jgi:hypothetical protein
MMSAAFQKFRSSSFQKEAAKARFFGPNSPNHPTEL